MWFLYKEGYPGYEVSTRGDRRFSALVARMPDGYTIEEHYQLVVKGHGELGKDHWKKGKGKPPLIEYTPRELYLAYRELWVGWARANPGLLEALRTEADKHDGKLSDCFAHGRPINQARALADILNRVVPL